MPESLKKIAKVILVFIVGIFILLVLSIFTLAVIYSVVNRTNGEIVSSGQKRAYLTYVPESYDPSKPTPLVLSLHGFVEWPAHQMKISRWNEVADKYGFIVGHTTQDINASEEMWNFFQQYSLDGTE